MNVTVLYVGSSLTAPLRRAEREINDEYRLDLRIAEHDCILPLEGPAWSRVELDLAGADIVFVIHVTETGNASRIGEALDRFRSRHRAVIVINCLGDLMRRTRMGERELFSLFSRERTTDDRTGRRLLGKLGSWMAGHGGARHGGAGRSPERYLGFISRLPALIRFVPERGALGDIKHYLTLFCYFAQPTPANIRWMILYALKHFMPGCRDRITTHAPERRPAMGIYHPDAASIFESFPAYRQWYEQRPGRPRLAADRTVGLLLLRPQIVSGSRRHYDAVIRAIESEGLPVIPALSTFMDNREACEAFFVDPSDRSPRVSQLLSLTGFSFVGGPAMNDSAAAAAYLAKLNCTLKSAVSLETQKIEHWAGSDIGLNPVQTAMQVAIPEVDGATEPFVYGGLKAGRDEPEPLEDRCRRIARRLRRWDRLRRLPRSELRLAFLIYCFPPNKGNLGTAADLDVFPSVWHVLRRLQAEGYAVRAPETPDALRELLLANGADGDHLANVAFRLSVDDYLRICPYVEEIEAEWGPAPGSINTQGRDILIHGIELGNVFLGIQPTFGYEGDPMRLLAAKGAAPHHGFMGLYAYLDKVYRADALVHVGTHGALEFMPGKQAGLSEGCWPDRLIGEFPNIYIYSVNNPSEGSIAKRRSYAELISYLTPPIENAGLYKGLASLKELITAYRQSRTDQERQHLFAAIEEKAGDLNMRV